MMVKMCSDALDNNVWLTTVLQATAGKGSLEKLRFIMLRSLVLGPKTRVRNQHLSLQALRISSDKVEMHTAMHACQ